MSDMAAGIPIGMAIGIGAGVGIGIKQARDNLREYVEQNAIILQDQTGQSIPIETFLDEAMETENPKTKKILRVFLVLGIATFVLGVAVYFFMK